MGSEKMKILFLNTNIGYGGASKMMVFVANRLAQAGHDVSFLTYRDNTSLQNLSPAVIHIHKPWEEGSSKGLMLVKTLSELHKYIVAEKFDVAVAFLSPSQLRLAIARLGTKTKTLFSQRGDPYQNNKNKRIGNWVTNKSFTSADYYVFQTEGAQKFYKTNIIQRSVIIPNPVEKSEVCLNNIQRDKRIVNVARLDLYQKRQDLLIKAFKKFNLEFPEYTLHLYGDGPDEEEIKSLIKGDNNIIMHGAVNNISEEIKTACMFVLTSDFEGIPNALIEAMELGIPCISTRCSPGGAELLISHNKNGLLAECGDVDGIVTAMKKYANDLTFATKMGESAKRIAEDFSEERIGNMWVDLFCRINKGEF